MEAKAANVLLELGEPVRVPAPILLRLLGKKTIEINVVMPTADTCLRAVAYRIKVDISDQEFEDLTNEAAFKLFHEHGKNVARCVAIVILKTRLMDQLFGRWLAGFLLKRFRFENLCDIMELVTVEGGLLDFMNIIRLMKTMRLMQRNNLSQLDQRS